MFKKSISMRQCIKWSINNTTRDRTNFHKKMIIDNKADDGINDTDNRRPKIDSIENAFL